MQFISVYSNIHFYNKNNIILDWIYNNILNDNINYDESIKINHNAKWSYIPDHPNRILIIVGLESGKTLMFHWV